ncbi:energy transducer TonB [Alphaproteobacteria bacterium]|nr:energy transducer TonB [Alphaproteobacteria bacterium]
MSQQFVNNKIIFLSIIIAIVFHFFLLLASKLIYIANEEEVEPKIILELMNDVIEDIKPVINEIVPPEIIKPQEIIKPPVIQPPKKLLLEKIENNIAPTVNPNLITIPTDLKPLINNKIDIPQPIINNNTDLSISELPKVIRPTPIIKNKKPIKTIIIPNLPEENEIESTGKTILPQVQELPKKPIKKIENTDINQNQTKRSISSDETSELNTYKNEIRNVIQSFAINNYPRKEKRRRIEGKVHIIFKLRLDGSIEYVKSGPNTNASEALIKAAIDSVKLSAPFKKIDLLKKKNEFSINIVYKINR